MLTDLREQFPQVFTTDAYEAVAHDKKKRRELLRDGIFMEGVQKPAREKPKIALGNGGMGVDISTIEMVLAMQKLGLTGMWSAACPGWKELMERLPTVSGPTARQHLHVETDEQAIMRAGEAFAERGAWVNIMRKLGNYKILIKALLESDNFDVFIVGAGIAEDLPEIMAQPQFKDRSYGIIVSDPRVARIFFKRFIKGKQNVRAPSVIYFENAKVAGGHLGPGSELSVEQVCEEIWKECPNTSIIVGGAFAYADQVKEGYRVANGVAAASRFAFSQEAGFSQRITKNIALNPDFPVNINMRSPTGYPASGVDNNLPLLTLQQQREALMGCISCVKDNPLDVKGCKLLEELKVIEEKIKEMRARDQAEGLHADWTPEDYYWHLVKTKVIEPNEHYCIKNELIRTRQDKELEKRGEGGVGWDPSSYLVFSGKQLESIRTDDVFRDAQGKIYVPTVEEQARFMLTHNAPPPNAVPMEGDPLHP